MSVVGTIGDYVIIDRIAVGGMAEIFLGKRVGPEKFEKAVVIKRLLPDLIDDEKFTAMFLDEARLAARLNHANIVQIYDLGRSGDSFYIAMEYLIGEDLSSIIVEQVNAGRLLPAQMAARIIAQAAEGLHYAHTLTDSDGAPLHIVHRDISPSNIVVTHQGHVKVVDFGIAKAADRVVRTETGVVKGKLAYMAPEQLLGRDVDCRTDVYALGVTLFEAVSCSRMFPDMQPMSVYGAIKRGEVPGLRERVPDVALELETIVSRCLAHEPADRYPTALDLQQELEQFVASAGRVPTAHDLAQMLSELFGAGYFDKMARRTQQKLASAVIPPQSLSAEDTVPESETPITDTVITERDADTVITGGDAEVTADITGEAEVTVDMPAPREPTTDVVASEETVIDGRRPPQTLRWWWPVAAALVLAVGVALWGAGRNGEAVPTGDPVERQDTALGILRLTTSPPGALAYLDGRRLPGVTPMTIPELDPEREHTLLVERERFESVHERFRVAAGEVVELTVVLDAAGPSEVTPVEPPSKKEKARRPKARTGFLTVRSNVPLRVRAGKRDLGATPVVRAELPVGRVSLVLSNAGEGIERRLRVNIRAGVAVEEEISLHKGRMSIDVQPWADIYRGKAKLGTTPMLDFPMWEGEYLLTLDNPQVPARKTIRVTIRPGKTTRVRTDL